MNTARNRTTAEPLVEIDESRVPVPSGYKDTVRYRKREAGMGYGQSSGYARKRRYAEDEAKDLFRLG
jgi:hypothetical protein